MKRWLPLRLAMKAEGFGRLCVPRGSCASRGVCAENGACAASGLAGQVRPGAAQRPSLLCVLRAPRYRTARGIAPSPPSGNDPLRGSRSAGLPHGSRSSGCWLAAVLTAGQDLHASAAPGAGFQAGVPPVCSKTPRIISSWITWKSSSTSTKRVSNARMSLIRVALMISPGGRLTGAQNTVDLPAEIAVDLVQCGYEVGEEATGVVIGGVQREPGHRQVQRAYPFAGADRFPEPGGRRDQRDLTPGSQTSDPIAAGAAGVQPAWEGEKAGGVWWSGGRMWMKLP